MSLEKQRIFWAILFFLMILSAFIVPFTPLLSNMAKSYGAFLFWNLFALVVIVFLGIITARWRDEDER
jgi:membrane protein YdbS with pleckstrin-like domain